MIYHIGDGIFADFFAANGGERFADSGKQQLHVIVDFRGGTYGGAAVFGANFLVYGYGRGKPFYIIHVRLFHLSQKLPRV